ncbi:antirestriction protein (plasmid) [Candidatus Tenderia electrophaga]|uniref:Antirestriction protein n=1 Tax=Candidatus Tenderia electrophaga TaxID=1748243 RepID=A0A0S2TIK7_9GAMM|nr:antirestriction protein [Candidatus Tenderia electrophaga]
MNNTMDLEMPVTATQVRDADRVKMLPKYFGRDLMRVESAIYAFMDRLCENYQGGYWDFYELSNGGFYMAPATEEMLNLSWAENYFQGEMSADAAGVVACLFAYNHLAWETRDESLILMYESLREYVGFHTEASLIFRAID